MRCRGRVADRAPKESLVLREYRKAQSNIQRATLNSSIASNVEQQQKIAALNSNTKEQQ